MSSTIESGCRRELAIHSKGGLSWPWRANRRRDDPNSTDLRGQQTFGESLADHARGSKTGGDEAA
jgi:hypothetical protein